MCIYIEQTEGKAQRSVGTGTGQFATWEARQMWFGHVDCKHNADSIKHCTMMVVNGITDKMG